MSDDFDRQLDEAYQKKVIERIQGTLREATFATQDLLVLQTPIDTGLARSNWIPSIGVPVTRTTGLGGSVSALSVLARLRVNDTIFITNNLPYIRDLNDGSSQQAPAGFVEGAVRSVANRINADGL